MIKRFISTAVAAAALFAVSGKTIVAAAPAQDAPKLQKKVSVDAGRDQRLQNMLAAAVRHELVTLPYYDVFDWLEAELGADGSVILRGEVVRASTADDAEKRVRRIESATRVVNQIKVLSVSSRDADLRVALYRAIYNWESPLFRYAMRAMPPIHIIVENGRAVLKGAVGTSLESQVAYTAARQVAGLFEVRNELRIDE